ncbi:alpha/beta hydrolase|uniref:alpha/beta fold hydrolase n=1 Tax=Stenotrophomonas sp. SbOxS2 TaxID=2723885 RepID=UPI0015D3E51E|nr:alpha/beta hydrolase [Stenotrophomonas sp. SbOxS2]NYT99449.1 alpha/beta hydrolase [Stenotrophomonas sp. SbOxS2]
MMTPTKAALPTNVCGEGRPVALLIHGFLDAGQIWSEVAENLSGEGITTAAIDLPGMGGSEAEPESISLDSYAQDLASVVDSIDGELVIVAQSMGAQVAELVARLRPAAVKGLVLITPVPLAGVGAPDEVVAPFRSSGGQADIQRQLRTALSHGLSDDRLDMLATLGLLVRPDVVARLVDVWNGGHETGQSKSDFPGPVLVIRGASDTFVTEDIASLVTDHFEHGVLETVAEAGHWAHVEQPAEIARLVASLIRSVGLAGGEVHASAADWRSAFAKKTQTAFGQALAANVVLEAVTLIKPVQGRENVQRVMETGSKIYSSLTFTDQSSAGNKQYLEWTAEAHEGMKFAGITILTRDDDGAIAHIAIHHRPMEAAIFFSKKMGQTLKPLLGPGYFLESEDAQGEVA